MGYLLVPNVREESVVCQEPCTHRDCHQTRQQFGEGAVCPLCQEPFQAYEAFYYQDGRPVHARCLWRLAEEQEGPLEKEEPYG